MRKIAFILFISFFLILSDVVLAQTTNNYKAPIDSAQLLKGIRKRADSLTLVIKNTSDPKHLARLYTWHGIAEFKLNKPDSAIGDYSAAINFNSELKEAYILRADLYLDQKEYEKAIKDEEKALLFYKNDNMNSANINAAIGYMELKLKNYSLSLKADSAAIVLNPNNTQAYANTGWAYLATKKYDKAIEYFTAGIAGYNNDKKRASSLIAGRADAKRALKKYRDAVNDYSLAIQLDPEAKLAYWNRASCYYQNGDYELAEKEYTKTIPFYAGDNANLARLYNDRANMEIAEQKYNEAFRDDSAAITHNLSFGPAYWGMGDAHAQNGDFQLSVVWYKETMKYYTDKTALSSLNNDIANESYFMGQYEQAIHSSTTAIELDAKAWGPYLNRGRAYLKQGKKDQAMDDFKKVLVLDTTSKSYEYAFALFYTGKPDEAIQVMQKNVVTTTNNAQLISHYYNLACLYSLINKPDEANTYLKKCIDEGYSKKYAKTDPDLENIRATKDFIDMMNTN